MQGNIRQRGTGSWELRVFVGRDPATGRKRYLTKTVRGGKRQAQRELVTLVYAAQQGAVSRSRSTVAHLLEAWFDHARSDLSPKTVIPNLVLAKLGDAGKVCLYSLTATNVVADVNGYFPAGSNYTPITNPTRILDTRNGTGARQALLVSDASLELQVGGVGGVPGDAPAVALNVTVTDTQGPGS